MDVKVVQHSGVRKSGGNTIREKLPLDRVYVDGVMLGYLPRRDNAKFLPLLKMRDDEAAPIVRKLNELRSEEGIFANVVGFGVGAVDYRTATKVFDELDSNATELEDDDDE